VNPFAVALFAGSKLSIPTAANSFPTPPMGGPVTTCQKKHGRCP
jgi:hypothetical protein